MIKFKTDILVEELFKYDKYFWLEFYNTFNKWKFPEKLSHLKPDWWPDSEGTATKELRSKMYLFMRPLMDKIKEEIPQYWIYKYHHIFNLKKTPAEFMIWYLESYKCKFKYDFHYRFNQDIKKLNNK